MVNNRMFSKPLSLNAIGAAAGLTAPISMSQLRGRTIYDSANTATIIPSGTNSISLSIFENKRFTVPINPVIFELTGFGNGTITNAGKKIVYNSSFPFIFRLAGGNTSPFYLHIAFIGINSNGRISLGDNLANFYTVGTTPITRSYYFANGITTNPFLVNFNNVQTGSATISEAPIYTVVNYVY